ncbi:hypothetical protein SAMN05444521_2293 [Streptomyces sp. 3214.6]|nr:hypothetical protein SAMN05444521_2293 [Streptomyces sp. 3214.6]
MHTTAELIGAIGSLVGLVILTFLSLWSISRR